jgi:sporulation protein YlmC with PRC-barrel domain
MLLSDGDLRGRTVIASDGLVIGAVAALFVDSETWRLEALQIRLRKDVADRLGANRGLFHAGALEVPRRLVQSVGDAVVLNAAVDDLRQLLPAAGEPAPGP